MIYALSFNLTRFNAPPGYHPTSSPDQGKHPAGVSSSFFTLLFACFLFVFEGVFLHLNVVAFVLMASFEWMMRSLEFT